MSDDLRAAFVRLLTTDSAHSDRRRRDYNQAIFHPEGWAIFSRTDLAMVMEAFDAAMKEASR